MRRPALAMLALLLALSAACAAPQRVAHAPAQTPPPAQAVPHDWPSLTDAQFGFSLRYPAGWTEKFDRPPGFHALASRATMTSLLDLADNDYWLVAQVDPLDPSTRCGEPVGQPTEKTDTTLGGQAATRYVATGSRGSTIQHIVLVVALRGTTCYTLQLVAGGAIPLDQALSTLRVIQGSYRYSR